MGNRLRAMASRILRGRREDDRLLRLSFESWDNLDGPILALCHPQWRGVKAATYAFNDPVVECNDLEHFGPSILAAARDSGVEVIVVHAFPPGTDTFLQEARAAGFSTRVVVHSSLAQHGAEAWEAAAVSRFVDLARDGVVGRIGFVKAGLPEAFEAMGVTAVHTPNRAPDLPDFQPRDLGAGGPHIGVFAEPFWRKNVITQLAATALVGGTAHVMTKPSVDYLSGVRVVEHGELPWADFVALQGSVDINLYVSLSECHPMSPMESYLAGVPCLTSRTSEVFASDLELWDITTVAEADNPVAIAEAARRLLADSEEAVKRATTWIRQADIAAAERWKAFVSS